MTDYMCPADPTVTHCYHAAKVNEIIRAHVSEITRLTARVKELEEALQRIASTPDYRLPKPQDIARAALTKGERTPSFGDFVEGCDYLPVPSTKGESHD